MLIQTMTGFENFQQCSAKAYVFVMPCQEFPGHEVAIGQAARGGAEYGRHVHRHGARQRIQAAPGLTEDFGSWGSAAYDVSEGMIFKLHAGRKTSAMQVGRHMNGCMVVRVREAAPLIRVWVGLTGDERAQFTRVNVIEGRMDILSLEATALFGVEVRPQFVSQFGVDNVELMFDVENVQPGITEAPIIETRERVNEAGETVTVATTRRRRALDL